MDDLYVELELNSVVCIQIVQIQNGQDPKNPLDEDLQTI